MTADVNNIPVVDEDLNTTAPNPEPEVWRMPEPVFRKTSGRLPRGFAKQDVPTDPPRSSDGQPVTLNDTTSAAPASPAAAVVPVQEEPKPKSPVLKIVIVAIAIAAMIAFIVVFLTVVYFFFLRS
ncbi:MAG TPA: hypothetical protein VFZ23_10275 [Pyrinomonadaceae bacterium]